MSILYFGAFCGVCVIVLALMFETIRSLRRKPVWFDRPPYEPMEKMVESIAVLDVAPRHSGFVGLTNEDEFQKIA